MIDSGVEHEIHPYFLALYAMNYPASIHLSPHISKADQVESPVSVQIP